MINFKSNYGLHKVEKAWQNFAHSDWLMNIMTSWERRGRHENFWDVEFYLTQSVADESSRRRSVQSTRTKSLFTKLAMSVHSSAFFCATGVWGGKPIGHVRVKIKARIFTIFTNFCKIFFSHFSTQNLPTRLDHPQLTLQTALFLIKLVRVLKLPISRKFSNPSPIAGARTRSNRIMNLIRMKIFLTGMGSIWN